MKSLSPSPPRKLAQNVVCVTAALLYAVPVFGAPQATTDRTDEIIDLAASPEQERLVRSLEEHPDAGREAIRRLLLASTRSGEPATGIGQEPLVSAERLAHAYFEAWNDPLQIRIVSRFHAWTVAERTEWAIVDSLRDAGNQAWVREGVQPAMDLWLRSRERAERLGDPISRVRALGNLAAGHLEMGRRDSARILLEASYDQAAEAGDLLTAANALTVWANLFYDEGRFADAVEAYGRSLDLLERTGSYRSAASNSHNLGLIALASGDLETARSSLRRAVGLSRLHGTPGEEIESLASLADVERTEGRMAEADSLLRRALALSKTADNRLAKAGTLQALGSTALARGDYRQAAAYLEEARASFDHLGRTDLAVDAALDHVRATAAAGEFGRAGAILAGITDSMTVARLTDADRAWLHLTTADLHLEMNRYPEALADYVEAEALFVAANRTLGEAAALQGQGLAHAVREEYDEALARLGTSAARFSTAGASREAAVARLQIAWTHERGGRAAVARSVIRGVAQELRELGDPVGLAMSLYVAGELELRAREAGAAAEYFEQGLATLSAIHAPEVTWRLQSGMAGSLRLRGDSRAAIPWFEAAIATIEASAATILELRATAAYASDKWDVFEDLALAQLELGDVNGAFATSERLRSRQTLALLQRGRIEPPPNAPQSVAREQEARRRLALLATDRARQHVALASADRLREPPAAAKQPAALDRLLAEAEAEYATVLEAVVRSREPVADILRPVPVEPSDVVGQLEPGEAFLEYLVTDSVVVGFVITREASFAQRLPIHPAALVDVVRFARGTIERDPSGEEGLWRTPLGRLHEVLVAPLAGAEEFAGIHHLYVAPHAELHYVPLAALLDRGETGDRFLVEQFTVTAVPSAAAWLAIRRRAGSPGPSERRVLAVAPHPVELPGSRVEVRAVADRLSPGVMVLVGQAASRAAVLGAAPGAEVIHLASYGVLNSVNPLHSYIELSDRGAGVERLEAYEIFGLNLDAALVVLSACETGVGSGERTDVPPGDDWIGLQRAFLTAGARSVVASLWRVPDLATAGLMDGFYENLQRGLSVSAALAEAQRAMLRDGASPFQWAAFTVAGLGDTRLRSDGERPGMLGVER